MMAQHNAYIVFCTLLMHKAAYLTMNSDEARAVNTQRMSNEMVNLLFSYSIAYKRL